MRYLFNWIRFVLWAFLSIVALVCILYAMLQSKWAKAQIQQKILSFLKEHNITAAIEGLEGKPPFTWTIKSADFSIREYGNLHLEEIRCRVAFIPLLRGKIAIDYLQIENASYSGRLEWDSEKGNLDQLASLTLPFPIAVHYFHISHAAIAPKNIAQELHFTTSGAIEAQEDLSQFLFSFQCASLEKTDAFLSLQLYGDKSQDLINFRAETHALPIKSESLLAEATLKCNLSGEWSSWHSLLKRDPSSRGGVKGDLIGMCANAEFPHLPLLNDTWKFRFDFRVPNFETLQLDKVLLSGQHLHAKGKAVLHEELETSQALFSFSLPDLNRFSFADNFPLEGNARGKILYKNGAFKTSLRTRDFLIAAHSIDQMKAIVKGNYSDKKWIASVKVEGKDAEIPFESSFYFDCVPEDYLSIRNFRFHLENGDVQGQIHYDIGQRAVDGSLDASIDHLDRFGSLFSEEYIEGNVGVYCQAWNEGSEQNLQLAFLGKNMRYRETLLEQLSITASLTDLKQNPEGSFHLLADKFYSPKINIDQLTFGTTSDEEAWPFFLSAYGALEQPFECHVKGSGIKDNTLYSLELTQLSGEFSGNPLELRYPSSLEWGSDFLNLSPFDFKIGQGKLYTAFELSPVRSLGKWELAHFPLEVLSSFAPRVNLSGHISASGFIDALPDSVQGALNAVIEKADFLHFGRSDPFKGKGSIQIHLDNNIVQVHTDLRAIDAQFLDFNATLPITYALYPFSVRLDHHKPAAAELITEGKLEDLFDFVNLGMNHLTGLISSRLFLSRTLDNPSLQGKLEWQNGTYENYFTGIALKEIQAVLEAENDTLQLISLTAQDKEEGTLLAEGKIELDPKNHFPYTFIAEQKNLHVLGFDMIDCNLTGPLYFSGNLSSATAQGNLLIDSAKIQLTEKLPYEIPTLPVTYIHRPPHLLSQKASVKPRFQFHIDLELTADEKVYVEGRGLNAELQGNVHLSGTNTNVVPSGSLELIKGEYQFSGKIFKLTEGEIVFLDKPTPSAYLNLSGTLALANATITANLSGPLTHPQLTFQSNPQMSTSSILALILFNKDISDISHPEALQLANTLMSLSGGAGPDVLETIRKTIGVDRLNISSASADSDEMAIQIGKYLTRGVLITLSQSATSTQIIVEVELPQGFVFQAETQEEQEGKFSLKWTKSY